jgi:hypothetical protein
MATSPTALRVDSSCYALNLTCLTPVVLASVWLCVCYIRCRLASVLLLSRSCLLSLPPFCF